MQELEHMQKVQDVPTNLEGHAVDPDEDDR